MKSGKRGGDPESSKLEPINPIPRKLHFMPGAFQNPEAIHLDPMNTEIDEGTQYSSIIIREGEPVSPARPKKHFEYDPHLDLSEHTFTTGEEWSISCDERESGSIFSVWVQLLAMTSRSDSLQGI